MNAIQTKIIIENLDFDTGPLYETDPQDQVIMKDPPLLIMYLQSNYKTQIHKQST